MDLPAKSLWLIDPPRVRHERQRWPAMRKVRVTFAAPPMLIGEPVTFASKATPPLKAPGRPHRLPAEDMMQAFVYLHLVPAESLTVNVYGRSLARNNLHVLGPLPVKIYAGQSASLSVEAGGFFQGTLQFELNDPPEGLTLQSGQTSGGRTQMVIQSDAAKIRPNMKGNLIIDVFQVRQGQDAAGKARRGEFPWARCRRFRSRSSAAPDTALMDR